MTRFVFIIIVTLSMQLNAQTKTKVVFLKNDHIEIGILPEVGGRMVYFGLKDSKNILHSDSTLWNEPAKDRIVPSPTSGFKAYNGFITWVGPQSEWWSHQNVNEAKHGDVWPPDPYLIYSNYKVLEQTNSSIVIEGPSSPVSGLKLTKYYSISGNKLSIKVIAQNSRDTDVAWDLWSNARFDAFTKFRIPVNEESILRINNTEDEKLEVIEHCVESGYFFFLPVLPTSDEKRRISKAFLHPSEGRMDAMKDSVQLIIEFDWLEKSKIHPEQALVEVYNCITKSGVDNILELEHHSAYQTLKPGETMELSETWVLSKSGSLDF